ncbi:hypothetical protein PybrP1_003204 [[Pythium] brassicae (nom. inval.)]|nr:hypothetical protein PybrP1_003204 [[Pythium] brassicae (nom. inval.)]
MPVRWSVDVVTVECDCKMVFKNGTCVHIAAAFAALGRAISGKLDVERILEPNMGHPTVWVTKTNCYSHPNLTFFDSMSGQQSWCAGDFLHGSASLLVRSDLDVVSRLAGKARQLEMFVANRSDMTTAERKLVAKTSMAALYAAGGAKPVTLGLTGARVRFAYFIPFVSHVCEGSLKLCYHVSPSTVVRYMAQVRAGCLVRKSRTINRPT